MRSLKGLVLSLALLAAALPFLLPANVESQTTATEAPTGFDDQTNGCVGQATHDADRATFETVETPDDGLGPTFNRKSCAGCHATPVSGGVSAITELRAGHLDADGNFVPATAFVNFGQEPIPNRSLINQRAICDAAQETLTDADPIRANRLTLNVLGDGFVEAIADSTLSQIRASQPAGVQGELISVPALEGFPGQTQQGMTVGRFGWKDQHVSLLSFSSDAYLNEMGISNRLSPNRDDFTHQCDQVADPEDTQNDIDVFARFMRATKAPPRDAAVAVTADAQAGSQLFAQIGCSTCHIDTIVTAPLGTVMASGMLLPDCVANKIIHPYSDFLLHDVGTGDSIVQNGPQNTAHKLRTAPLWGLRTHPVFMHDGASATISDAIARHAVQAKDARSSFNHLSAAQQQQVLTFLSSL
jgi:CxxC motif-containing protein (DUF1111 family)